MSKRNAWLRRAVIVVTIGAVVAGIAVSPVGALTVKTASVTTKKVKKIATNVFNKNAATLKDACPSATTRYAGACFETASRGAANFDSASNTCGNLGRRLPTASELLGLRNVSGITLAGSGLTTSEMTSNIYRDSDFGFMAVGEDGSIFSHQAIPFSSVTNPFRCVASLTNS